MRSEASMRATGRWVRVLVAAVSLLMIAEVALRLGLGLARPPLSYPDPDFGYAFVANQELYRFGRRIAYNSLGMRSEEIDASSSAKVRILCIGDSVTNGGAPTDQEDTFPYQLEASLNTERGSSVRTMNISAASWGIENQLEYLRKNGLFGATLVVVQVGTHDLYQGKSTGDKIGSDLNFPDKNPASAIRELLTRYLLPGVARFAGSRRRLASPRTEDDLEHNLGSLLAELNLIRAGGAVPILLVTCDRVEAEAGAYETSGPPRLRMLAETQDVLLIEMLPSWNMAFLSGRTPYRHGVHPNELGYRLMAERVAEELAGIL